MRILRELWLLVIIGAIDFRCSLNLDFSWAQIQLLCDEVKELPNGKSSIDCEVEILWLSITHDNRLQSEILNNLWWDANEQVRPNAGRACNLCVDERML